MKNVLQELFDNEKILKSMYPTQLLKNTKNSEKAINFALNQMQNEFLQLNPSVNKENCDFYNDVYIPMHPMNRLLFHVAFFYTMMEEYKKLYPEAFLSSNEQINKLLNRADSLISLLYREIFDKKYDYGSMVGFFADEPKCTSGFINSAYFQDHFPKVFVKAKEMETLNKLYSIFVKIDKNLPLYSSNQIVMNNYKQQQIKSK